jgi:serine/threonine protein kinase
VPTLEAGESFGRYQITRPLGCGAMGAVYLAYDSQLHRYVALKTPFLGRSRDVIERFYREARATSQLRSPQLCPIYDVGEISGIHYLSMAFIEGQPLEQAIAEEKYKDPVDAARLVQKIARGLQKAHEQSVVHRDLKPENIMIDGDGEPIVMDFGLARRLDDDIQHTAPGRLLGTPAYMSPEQVTGDPTQIGPATDIYSLGVVLYKLLTGQIPFQGSLTSVLHQIGSVEPPRPSTTNPALAAESPLELICLKMMAKSPADRFPSMAAVADALNPIISNEQVVATSQGKPSALKRLWSWAQSTLGKRSDPAPQAAAGQQAGSAAFKKSTLTGERNAIAPAGSKDQPTAARKSNAPRQEQVTATRKSTPPQQDQVAATRKSTPPQQDQSAATRKSTPPQQDQSAAIRKSTPPQQDQSAATRKSTPPQQGKSTAPRKSRSDQTIDLAAGMTQQLDGQFSMPSNRDQSEQTLDLSAREQVDGTLGSEGTVNINLSNRDDEDATLGLDGTINVDLNQRDDEEATLGPEATINMDLSDRDDEDASLGPEATINVDLNQRDDEEATLGPEATINVNRTKLDETAKTIDITIDTET